MALTGTELVLVTGVMVNGVPSGQNETTTTTAILAGTTVSADVINFGCRPY